MSSDLDLRPPKVPASLQVANIIELLSKELSSSHKKLVCIFFQFRKE